MFFPSGELYDNQEAPLTRWFVETGLITEFTLIDVGVRGGISGRWQAFGPALRVYGFDLFADAIEPLPKGDRFHYFLMALGEKDGEIEVVNKGTETMMYAGAPPPGEVAEKVPVRKLDTLFKEGTVPPADFIKMDCEGFERYVLDGAEEYLAASNLVGADIESSFHMSVHNELSQFVQCLMPFARQRLLLGDIQMTRNPTASLVAYLARGAAPAPNVNVEKPRTLNVLFTRVLQDERVSPANYAFRPPEHHASIDTLLKAVAVFECYGLIGAAFELLEQFRERLSEVLNVDEAQRRLFPLSDVKPSQGDVIRRQTVGSTSGRDLAGELARRILVRLGF